MATTTMMMRMIVMVGADGDGDKHDDGDDDDKGDGRYKLLSRMHHVNATRSITPRLLPLHHSSGTAPHPYLFRFP